MEIILILIGGFVVYMYASRHSRRDRAVEVRVRRMMSDGRSYAVFNDIYFEAARAYAIAKGCSRRDHDAASADIMIDGRAISVTFLRDSAGGTTFITESVASRDAWLEAEMVIDMIPAASEPVQETPSRHEKLDMMTNAILTMVKDISGLPDLEYVHIFQKMGVPTLFDRNLRQDEMAHYIRLLLIYINDNPEALATYLVDDVLGADLKTFKKASANSGLISAIFLRGMEMISKNEGHGNVSKSDFEWVDFELLPVSLQAVLSKFDSEDYPFSS